MPMYIQRFLIEIIPYVACSTIAALIIWEEKVKKILFPLLLFIMLSSAAQTATYLIRIESIRFCLEVIGGFLLALLIFRKTVLWIVKIYITSYILGTITVVAAFQIIVALGIMQVSDVYDNVLFWIYVGTISNLAMLAIAFLIHIGKIPFKTFLHPLLEHSPRILPLLLAIFIQMTVFVSFNLDFSLNKLNPEIRSLIVFFLYGLSIFIFLRFVRVSVQDAEITLQENVAKNIEDMVNSVKGQRHDFNNHLHVINVLCKHHDYMALEEYVHNLVQETTHNNELLKIDNSILSALINAKITQANDRDISVNLNVESGLSGVSHISLELARILGNLIDNAMDEVEDLATNKYINLEIAEKGPFLVISVGNPWNGDPLTIEKAFNHGMSTKDAEHQGLGLQICKQLAKKIHASFDYSYLPGESLTFKLTVPREQN